MEPATPTDYMLIIRESDPGIYGRMTADQRQELLTRWNAWCDSMAAAGALRQGHPLEPEGRVVSGAQGRVTDGPFAEAKEAVGGFFIVRVADIDAAVAIARGCPSLEFGVRVEVRPVAGECGGLGVQARPAEQHARA